MNNKDILKKIRQIDIRLRRKVDHLFSGSYRSAFKGQGMVFSDFREYVHGDDVRAISWNLMARMGEPYIKTFEEEREARIMLVADISRSFHFGSGEQSKGDVLSLLSGLLAFCAQKNRDSVGLLLFAEDVELYLPPKKGVNQAFRILREVCRPRKSLYTDINPAFSFLQNILKKRSYVFILSDFLFSKPWSGALQRFAKRHNVVNVVISDPLEEEFPSLGLVDVMDLESGKTCTFSSSSPIFQRDYKEILQDHIKKRNKALLKSGAELISIDTGEDIYAPFIQFFNKKAGGRSQTSAKWKNL